MNERDIARALAAREHGQCEVQTPAGFIDVLTPTWLYEVKAARQWKSALGQVLSYGRYYPAHTLALYLFGKTTPSQRALIAEHCALLQVKVIWHTEPKAALDAAQNIDGPPTAIPPNDGLTLRLTAIDRSHDLTSSCTISLRPPETLPSKEALQQYLDEAWVVFDSLLDNELTLSLHAVLRGERITLKHTRADVGGEPVWYKLALSMMTDQARTFAISLPGIRAVLPSGKQLSERYDYAATRQVPEIIRLRTLILHPEFPWISSTGSPAASLMRAYWRSTGARKTRTGWKIGG